MGVPSMLLIPSAPASGNIVPRRADVQPPCRGRSGRLRYRGFTKFFPTCTCDVSGQFVQDTWYVERRLYDLWFQEILNGLSSWRR